ncbi:uncharacterized protein LY89DRAFT_578468 [Mollisia scopiformis]|uniref:Uncharacterized protein n=1 Tax=Mollisia scopiformis TaxID=149040 RepID=A0A194XJD7_MOLSC|nr:uncharacterized protein LY89DRAFT_578468 [Mollisia scopiformis]KUJ20360.1 hypothetical protein LY89DRAFT_578468 [Mollisia scopiformis]
MNRLYIFFALCAFLVTTLAASPPSFCKCTCFTNSTIIPLSSHSSGLDEAPSRSASATCATCNKAFCLAQRLPICKDAEEKDVYTTCFQRDSRKDQIVVLTFIGGTIGLLVWAAVRKFLEKRKGGEVRMEDTQRGYAPVGR